MARGGTINVTFTGDESRAKRAIENVERSLEGLEQEARRSGRLTGEHLERMDDAAGNTERGFRGLNDGIGGTTAVLETFGVASGGAVGQVGGLIQGFTDLAGFVGDFAAQLPPLLVKMGLLTVATETETGAQYALNTAFLANPIFLVVAALAALAVAFYVAWQHSETFRNIVTGAFDAVVGAAQAVWHWIADNWPYLLAILTGPFGLAVVGIIKYRDDISRGFAELYDWFARLFGDLADVLRRPFETLYDVAKWAWEAVFDGFHWLGDQLSHVFDGLLGAADWLISKVQWLLDHIPSIHLPSIPGSGFVGSVAGHLNPFGAEGAIVTRPTWSLIGEAGPEALIPLNRMPGASPLPGGLGGDVTVYVQSFDPAAAGRLVQEALLGLGFRNGGRTGLR